MQVVNNYIAHTDSKKRITLRKSKFNYYEVREFENNRCLTLIPKILKNPDSVSNKTLEVMDKSVANFKKRKSICTCRFIGFLKCNLISEWTFHRWTSCSKGYNKNIEVKQLVKKI